MDRNHQKYHPDLLSKRNRGVLCPHPTASTHNYSLTPNKKAMYHQENASNPLDELNDDGSR